jgi:hypothetical protein
MGVFRVRRIRFTLRFSQNDNHDGRGDAGVAHTMGRGLAGVIPDEPKARLAAADDGGPLSRRSRNPGPRAQWTI